MFKKICRLFYWVFRGKNKPIWWFLVCKSKVQLLIENYALRLGSKTLILWRTKKPLLDGKRDLYALYDPENIIGGSGNPERKWFDQEYRAFALLNDTITITYANIPDANLEELNSIGSSHSYKVIDGTNQSNTHLGNVFAYLRIANGNYPVAWIALDYDVSTHAELKEKVFKILDNYPNLKAELEMEILK